MRSDIAAIATPDERFAGRNGRLRVLVLGGSQGAKALNDIVPRAIALMPETQRPDVTHQAGAAHVAAVSANYADSGVQASVIPFIEDMAANYAAADLMICRSGASTIAELAAAGVPAVLGITRFRMQSTIIRRSTRDSWPSARRAAHSAKGAHASAPE